ncbi:MAG: YbjN domain-containing protein [Leptolyngbyaceae bacterium]|nr:YbjN domain-containing protein [Leptolyngbyaceae bacterium]
MTYNLELDRAVDAAFLDDSPTQLSIVEMIETVIFSLEEEGSAMVSHDGHSSNQSAYLWKFKYGSVEVFVQLTGTTDEDTFSVWAKVLQLPAKNEPQLMRKLLEMNWAETFEACFCILGDAIAVATSRTVAELSPGEVSRNITIVATIADDHDDLLQAEFGQS